MNVRTIITAGVIAIGLYSCKTVQVQESTTTTTTIKDTTVKVVVPTDSAATAPSWVVGVLDTTHCAGNDSIVTVRWIARDTTIRVKTDMAEATYTIKNGKGKLELHDGKGKKDSIDVNVKGGVRESTKDHSRVEMVVKKSWWDYFPYGILILGVIFLVVKFIGRR